MVVPAFPIPSIYLDRRFSKILIPIKIKYLVLGFGLIEFFGTLSSAAGTGSNISHIGHLGGLVSGFIYLMVAERSSFKGRSMFKSKKSGSILSDSMKKARLKKKQKEIETRIEAKKVIDELLEKIARSGMGSLTDDEKKKLEWARRNYYPDKKDLLH